MKYGVLVTISAIFEEVISTDSETSIGVYHVSLSQILTLTLSFVSYTPT